MKLRSIKKLEETDHFIITEVKYFKSNIFGKQSLETRKVLIVKLGTISGTPIFYHNGETLPVSLWEPFNAFGESKLDYISF